MWFLKHIVWLLIKNSLCYRMFLIMDQIRIYNSEGYHFFPQYQSVQHFYFKNCDYDRSLWGYNIFNHRSSSEALLKVCQDFFSVPRNFSLSSLKPAICISSMGICLQINKTGALLCHIKGNFWGVNYFLQCLALPFKDSKYFSNYLAPS